MLPVPVSVKTPPPTLSVIMSGPVPVMLLAMVIVWEFKSIVAGTPVMVIVWVALEMLMLAPACRVPPMISKVIGGGEPSVVPKDVLFTFNTDPSIKIELLVKDVIVPVRVTLPGPARVSAPEAP